VAAARGDGGVVARDAARERGAARGDGAVAGELARGAPPEATIAKAKAFLEECGLLERLERIVAHAEERTRNYEERYVGRGR
jgi:hypothetical protein